MIINQLSVYLTVLLYIIHEKHLYPDVKKISLILKIYNCQTSFPVYNIMKNRKRDFTHLPDYYSVRRCRN
jgi:hypothetical protein